VFDLVLAQRVIADAGAEAAVGEHAVDAHTGVLGLGDRAAEQAVIAGVACARDVGDHEALAGVGDARLVAELGRPPGGPRS
jgi:hypothetical protein